MTYVLCLICFVIGAWCGFVTAALVAGSEDKK